MENTKTLKRAFTKHVRMINADLANSTARQAKSSAFEVNGRR